jgi:pimeloyl-ACP methyl ester carboxylesterase/TolA-binding protein
MRIKLTTSISLLLLATLSISCSHSKIKSENIESKNVNDSVRKIDIGGYSVYTTTYGKGRPTVIFECGGGNTSDVWKFVQPEIAKITQTFSYDRPGIGRSDESPLQRTVVEQVRELRILLEKAQIKPPYIFVPNSYGAFVSRLFAYMYPEEVAGIVFVDGTSEKLPEFIKKSLSFFKFQFFKFSARSDPDGNYNEFYRSGQVVKEAAKTDGLRNTPIIVLTSDIRVMVKQYADLMTINNSPWMGWQNEIAALSNKSKHYVVYGSGHLIHMDNPKVVIKAITKLLHNEYNWQEKSSGTSQIISLPLDKMKQYEGRYLISVDDVLTIKDENGHFYATMPYLPKAEIFPLSEQKVLVKDHDFKIKLVANVKPNSDYLIITGKYVMDSIIATRIDESYHTPYENLVSGNINEAIIAYKENYKADPINNAFSEARFNSLGYTLLSEEKINEAIAIFKLNTEIYPRSANAFDSLAEAYMKAGKNELAIQNYGKSLALNPDNRNAKKMITKLKQ